jgi:hypothetical protein
MSILNVSGIEFSDGSQLSSRYGIIPQNTVSIFYQAAAPTGWTKITTQNDKTLRVVSGNGGGTGGSISFTSAFPSAAVRPISGSITAAGSVGNTTLTIAQLPSHTHNSGSTVNVSPSGAGVAGRLVNDQAPAGGATGGGAAHTHPFTGASSPFSASIDLRVQYIDVIICSFN